MQIPVTTPGRREQDDPGGEYVLGIDIGTSFARAALLHRSGRLAMVRDAYGDEQFPAVVRYTMRGSDAGYYPERFQITDAENSIREVPRFFGRFGSIPQRVIEAATARVHERNGRASFDVLYRTVGAEEVYARLASFLADLAARQAGCAVRQAVVAVPANAEDRMRVSASEALEMAGLRLLRLANQPTAAIVALRRMLPTRLREGLVAVVDMGGGTTDVTIARLRQGSVEIVATAGDPYLGAVELRRQVAEAANLRFRAESGVDLLAQRPGHSRAPELALLRAAGEALVELGHSPTADIVVDHGGGFGRDLWTRLGREEVEEWIAPSMERVAALCHRALRQAGKGRGDLAAVVMCGGGAMSPAARRTVAATFGRAEEELIVREPLALSALGAAILAGVQRGWIEEQVSDVTPYALGIAAYDAPYPSGRLVFSPVVRPGTPIPTPSGPGTEAPSKPFYTRYPYQTELELRVLQYRGTRFVAPFGAAPTAAEGDILPEECEELGCWTLSNIQPRHTSEVGVAFAVDANGILQLEAREQGTTNGLKQEIRRW